MDGRRSTVNLESTISTPAAQTLELATYACNALHRNRMASYPAKIKRQRLSLVLREALLPRNAPHTQAPCLAALAARTKGRWTLIQTEWASVFACVVDSRNAMHAMVYSIWCCLGSVVPDRHPWRTAYHLDVPVYSPGYELSPRCFSPDIVSSRAAASLPLAVSSRYREPTKPTPPTHNTTTMIAQRAQRAQPVG